MSAKHLPPASSPGDGSCSARLGAQDNIQEGFLSSALTEETGRGVRVPGTLALLQPHPPAKGRFQPRPRLPLGGAGWSRPAPTLGLLEWGPHREVTWKEVKESSVNSLTKRSTPRACSSITKAKMTSCVPSRGMSVSVDLASLGVVGQGHYSGPLSWPLLPVLCSRLPPRPGIWVTEPSPTKYPGTGCLEGRK